MDEACAEHLDVDAHRIHIADALGDVGHAREHRGGPALDAASHLVGDAGIGGQPEKDVVLSRHRVDLRHDDVGVEVDSAWPRAAWLRHVLRSCFTNLSRIVS